MGSNEAGGGFFGLKFRDVGVGLLLACISWFLLTALWTMATPGGLYDKIVGGLFSLPYRAGKHLTHVMLPNTSVRNATAYYIAPVVGIGSEILFLLLLWLAVLAIARSGRRVKRDGQIRGM
jgi:hypothetical protein